jgi:hypothetical protein
MEISENHLPIGSFADLLGQKRLSSHSVHKAPGFSA